MNILFFRDCFAITKCIFSPYVMPDSIRHPEKQQHENILDSAEASLRARGQARNDERKTPVS
jgi:hypothetical protein